jgi:hypothetical protein
MGNDALAAALRDVDDEATHARLQTFLRSGPNANIPLADGLNLAPRYYLGPISLLLAQITRCCGPEPEMPFHDPEVRWRPHVVRMAQAIEAGWEPPALLFHMTSGHLMDGNHRHAALETIGRESHPTLLIFNSADERAAYVARRLSSRGISSLRRKPGGLVAQTSS